jgi:predicted dehydrogenase
VTVGNYPGIEARIFGSEGALICRLVEEFGVIQTLHGAKPDVVEFVPMDIPERFFPPGCEEDDEWGTVFFGGLVHDFLQEIVDGGVRNQGDFAQSARVQEIINAVVLSHRERRWVALPLDGQDSDVGGIGE